MAKVKVLVEGYAREEKMGEYASSTVTLIQEHGRNIIVDPGLDRKKLLAALEKEGLSPKDIHAVLLTHNHLDHILLAGIFENAEVYDSSEIYSFRGRIEPSHQEVSLSTVDFISTPGHDKFHTSFSVETDEGKVVIASDLFWWKDSQEQKTDRESLLNLEDPYVKDKEALIKSRKKVLKIADIIIPGHGKMFKVEK